MIRNNDLRKDYKARRLRQMQFIRENPDADIESLARTMIAEKIYSPKTTLEEAIRRIVWERENPTKIGPKRIRPALSVEQIKNELAKFNRHAKKASVDLEKLRRQSMRAIGRFLSASGWEKRRGTVGRSVNWVDPMDRQDYKVDMAFLVANTRAMELERMRREI